MSEILAGAAVVVWALGVVMVPLAGALWIRDRRHGLALAAFAAAFLVQAGWVVTALRAGAGSIVERGAGFPEGWGAWAAGVGGLAALGSAASPRKSSTDRRASDRFAELAVGLFGLGILLRQLALAA